MLPLWFVLYTLPAAAAYYFLFGLMLGKIAWI